jgi:hypothetical protein
MQVALCALKLEDQSSPTKRNTRALLVVGRRTTSFVYEYVLLYITQPSRMLWEEASCICLR